MTFIKYFYYHIGIESEQVNENHVSKDDTLDVTSTLDSQINGYAANGTITVNVPASKEKSEIPNGKDSSSTQLCDFKDVSCKNNSLDNTNHNKFQNKNFAPLHIDCEPVSIVNLNFIIFI